MLEGKTLVITNKAKPYLERKLHLDLLLMPQLYMRQSLAKYYLGLRFKIK